jgi:hypothetical protein
LEYYLSFLHHIDISFLPHRRQGAHSLLAEAGLYPSYQFLNREGHIDFAIERKEKSDLGLPTVDWSSNLDF